MAVIAIVFAFAVMTKLLSIYIPELNAWLNPRFGFGLALLLFPLNFLCLFFWRPAPGILLAAAGMTVFVALASGGAIWLNGTVESVSNPFIDKLHSAYLYAMLPEFIVALYLGCIAWQIRDQIPMKFESSNRGN